jgi:hypothetical protein
MSEDSTLRRARCRGGMRRLVRSLGCSPWTICALLNLLFGARCLGQGSELSGYVIVPPEQNGVRHELTVPRQASLPSTEPSVSQGILPPSSLVETQKPVGPAPANAAMSPPTRDKQTTFFEEQTLLSLLEQERVLLLDFGKDYYEVQNVRARISVVRDFIEKKKEEAARIQREMPVGAPLVSAAPGSNADQAKQVPKLEIASKETPDRVAQAIFVVVEAVPNVSSTQPDSLSGLVIRRQAAPQVNGPAQEPVSTAKSSPAPPMPPSVALVRGETDITEPTPKSPAESSMMPNAPAGFAPPRRLPILAIAGQGVPLAKESMEESVASPQAKTPVLPILPPSLEPVMHGESGIPEPAPKTTPEPNAVANQPHGWGPSGSPFDLAKPWASAPLVSESAHEHPMVLTSAKWIVASPMPLPMPPAPPSASDLSGPPPKKPLESKAAPLEKRSDDVPRRRREPLVTQPKNRAPNEISNESTNRLSQSEGISWTAAPVLSIVGGLLIGLILNLVTLTVLIRYFGSRLTSLCNVEVKFPPPAKLPRLIGPNHQVAGISAGPFSEPGDGERS